MVPLNILVVLKSLEIEGHANPAVHLTFSCAKVDGTTPQRWLQHQGRLMWKSFRLTNIEIRSLTFFFGEIYALNIKGHVGTRGRIM